MEGGDVSDASLVPVFALAGSVSLEALTPERLTVPTDTGANAGLEVSLLVAGMVARRGQHRWPVLASPEHSNVTSHDVASVGIARVTQSCIPPR